MIDTAPDWVCELLSPGHEAHDTRVKPALYLEHRVPYHWVVNPEGRTLEAFELADRGLLLLGTWTDGDVARIPPFDSDAAGPISGTHDLEFETDRVQGMDPAAGRQAVDFGGNVEDGGDLNGDGHDDLIVTAPVDDDVWVLFGDAYP